MTDYKKLVEALRDIEKTMFALGTSPINMDNVSIRLAYDKRWGPTANAAADAIEALQAELPKRGEIVRCMDCKYWSEVDTSDGLRYGQCDRPHSAIRGNCFIRESWFCADGERKVQDGQ